MTITQKFPGQLGIRFELQSASCVLSHMFSGSLIFRFILSRLSAFWCCVPVYTQCVCWCTHIRGQWRTLGAFMALGLLPGGRWVLSLNLKLILFQAGGLDLPVSLPSTLRLEGPQKPHHHIKLWGFWGPLACTASALLHWASSQLGLFWTLCLFVCCVFKTVSC